MTDRRSVPRTAAGDYVALVALRQHELLVVEQRLLKIADELKEEACDRK